MTVPNLSEALQRKLDTLPEGPGVYLWKDDAGEVLYVGKAKRLKSRVRSYFATDYDESPKHRLLQRLIADVETIVVPSEPESLILENNLIKEYRPRFNVSLKDDKSYPSIAVTLADPFPGSSSPVAATFRGPGISGPIPTWRSSVEPWRSSGGSTPCGAAPTTFRGRRRERPCLDYHIGRCLAPCVGWQPRATTVGMVTGCARLPRGTNPGRPGEGARGDARGQRARRLRARARAAGRACAGSTASRSRRASR